MGSSYYNTGDRNYNLTDEDRAEIKENNYGLIQAALNNDHEEAKMCLYKGASVSEAISICSENPDYSDFLDTAKVFFEKMH